MANLGEQLECCYPDWEWYEDSLDYYVEDLKAKGIEIDEEKAGTRRDGKAILKPAISFSGFCSQGDGLAFDCRINWPVFFEAHPSFKGQMPEWYLLLSANPDYFDVGTRRHGRDSNCMSAWSEEDFPDVVENGFFAGMEMFGEVPELSTTDLEDWILDVCQYEAHKMYKGLEEEYDQCCESEKERRCEEFVEENRDVLARCVAALMLEDEIRNNTSCVGEASEGEISFSDLNELGLVEHTRGGVWQITTEGKKL